MSDILSTLLGNRFGKTAYAIARAAGAVDLERSVARPHVCFINVNPACMSALASVSGGSRGLTMRRRHSLFSSLLAIAAFVISYRRTLQTVRRRVEPLRPHSRRSVNPPARKSPISRESDSPQEILAKGWWAVGKRVAKQFSDNELMSEAASVTFFALLSVFPALTALVSLYGLFNDPSTIQAHLDNAAGFVPSGGMEIISEQVKNLTASPKSGLSFGAVAGVIAALWSANQGSKAVFSALNDVYGERETRSFVRKTVTTLAFTIGGLLAMLVAFALVALLPLAFDRIGMTGAYDFVARIARWPLIFIGLVGSLALLYRFGPSRKLAKWRWVTWGGAIAAVAWIGLSIGFSWYVAHFGNYNKTYGSLGAAIGFMTWIWLSCTVILLGAQINAELEMQTARDTTAGREKPRGRRGASAADQVA